MTTNASDVGHNRPLPSTGLSRLWSSARLRLTVSIAVTVALVFAAVLLIGFQLLWLNTERVANEQISEETSDFVSFAREGSLPSTGMPSPTVTALLRAFMTTRYPDSNTIYVATSNDGLTQFTLSKYPENEDDGFDHEVRQQIQEIGLDADSASSGLISRGGVRWGKVVIDTDVGHASLTVAVNAEIDHRQNLDVILLMFAASLVGLVLATWIAWFVAGRTLDPVRRIRGVARQISAEDLSQRVPEAGADEFSAMARTVNEMLDRVESAYRTQRDFLNDAGHELRTPLTVVQGNLDLLPDDPEGRAETLRIVQDELTRMTRIVEDLLTLARSNRPDFLCLDEVEIADLTLDIEAKIEVTAERDWVMHPEFDGRAVVDPHRVTQALIQFCANAVRFTGPGDRIEIGNRRLERGSPERGASDDGDRLLWWVSDTGAGIPEGQEATIFERFQTARGQLRDGRGGTGLGLAIVSSIAAAHGGTTFAYNNPDRGATFCISLPLVCTLDQWVPPEKQGQHGDSTLGPARDDEP